MFFGILFNSCFSLFNSLEIHFNKESFLKLRKPASLYNKQWREFPVYLLNDYNFWSKYIFRFIFLTNIKKLNGILDE